MPGQRQTRIVPSTKEYQQTQEKAMDFMLNLALGAISLLFVGLTFAYTFGRRLSENWETFDLPKTFWLSTLLLAGTSAAFHYARNAYLKDDTKALRLSLWLAFATGIGFLVSQFIGWGQLSASGNTLTNNTSASYLYLISWLHAAHVAVGLVFLAFSLQTAMHCTRDDIQSLLYFSDPSRSRRLRMVSQYWHVVDGLWIYLFVFFLFFHS